MRMLQKVWQFKKTALASLVAASLVLPMAGCSSTTGAGAVGANRKQLLLVSSDEVMNLASKSYQQTLSQARQKGVLDVNASQLARLKRIANHLIPQTSVY